MESLEHLAIERVGGLARVTLNRPPVNALNPSLIAELAYVAGLLSNDETQVVLLRSALPVFIAGGDLEHMNDYGWDELSSTVANAQAAANAWADIPAATIAAINGHAIGGGCEFALACDWRVMSRGRGRIGLPEGTKGLLPAAGGTQRMLRVLGPARALDMCARGRLVDADYAEHIGLIHEAVDPAQLVSRSEALATELLELPQMTFRAVKRCIREGADTSLAGGLAVEAREMVSLGATHDAREGVSAFMEKRSPVFLHR